jgi:hypothetical protein
MGGQLGVPTAAAAAQPGSLFTLISDQLIGLTPANIARQ